MAETMTPIPPGNAKITPRLALLEMLTGAGFDGVKIELARHGAMRWHATADCGVIVRGYGSPTNCVRCGMELTKTDTRQWAVRPRDNTHAKAAKPKQPHPVVNGELLIPSLIHAADLLREHKAICPRDHKALTKRLIRRSELYYQ